MSPGMTQDELSSLGVGREVASFTKSDVVAWTMLQH